MRGSWRRDANAWCRRDLTVPGGTPVAAAISSMLKPSTKRSSTASRCAGESAAMACASSARDCSISGESNPAICSSFKKSSSSASAGSTGAALMPRSAALLTVVRVLALARLLFFRGLLLRPIDLGPSGAGGDLADGEVELSAWDIHLDDVDLGDV